MSDFKAPSSTETNLNYAQRPTMRDIAKAMGVHHTTVSMALRDSSAISEATKRKVREVAERMGYRPDPMLTALNIYRHSKHAAAFQSILGWIDNWEGEPGRQFQNHTYKAYYDGACARACELGYIVEVFRMHQPGMTPQRMQQITTARNVGGLLISPQEFPGSPLGMDFSETSALAFGYSYQPNNLNLITVRREQVIDLLVGTIYQFGYRRLGYGIPQVGDSGDNFTWISRLNYFISQHPDMAAIPRAEDFSPDGLRKWITKNKPDVIIGYADMLKRVEALGYSVPGDFGFASPACNIINPRISGVNQHDFLIGKVAVDVLVGMIHRNEKGTPEVPIRTYVDCVWFEGKTLAARAPASVAASVRASSPRRRAASHAPAKRKPKGKTQD